MICDEPVCEFAKAEKLSYFDLYVKRVSAGVERYKDMPKVFVKETISFCVVCYILLFVTVITKLFSLRNSDMTFISSCTVPSAQLIGPLFGKEQRAHGREEEVMFLSHKVCTLS